MKELLSETTGEYLYEPGLNRVYTLRDYYLKPCPFCGDSSPVLEFEAFEIRARCVRCGATSARRREVGDGIAVRIVQQLWNNRVQGKEIKPEKEK